MALREIRIPPFVSPDGTNLTAVGSFTLQDLNGSPLLGLLDPDGEPITGSVSFTVTDTRVDIELSPQTEIAPESEYKLSVTVSGVVITYRVQVAPGDAPLYWGDLVLAGDPVSEADLTALAVHAANATLHAGGVEGAVTKVGTPVDNQVAVWTGDGTAEGTSGLTYDGSDLGVTGNVVVSGTVDGRDLQTDGSKLDGVEPSATGDQSNAEIKTAYEANADTNEFSDAEQTKLSGIETAADVTDATNVDAAGAVMESDVDAKGDVFVATADNTLTRLAVGANDQVLTADSAEASGVKWADASGGGAFEADVDTQITPTTPIVLDHATNDEAALTLSYTTNKAAGNDSGLVINQTDTASPGTSRLADFKSGGTPVFYVRNNGNAHAVGSFVAGAGFSASNSIFSAVRGYYGYQRASMSSAGYYGFAPAANVSTVSTNDDIRLYRDAAGTLAQRNSTNAQAFNIYNTHTDASNYERLSNKWNSNVYEIASEAAGTGTLRGIMLGVSGNSLGVLGATPVAQQSGTGETTGFTAGSGTAVNDDSTFTGNVGSAAYRINDVVKALKNYGLLAQ